MVYWFQETFSSASEQANLFSILVSTLLAVSLLLANQWFNTRKAKRELIISKIEELLINTYAYERQCLDVLSRLYNLPPNQQETIDKMAQSVELADKIEMLCALYFSNIDFKSGNSQSILLKVHNQFDAVELGNDYPKNKYLSYSQSTNELRNIIDPLKSEMKGLMKEHT